MSDRIRYTLADLRVMTDDTITPAIAADVLGCTGHLLGRMCHEQPDKVEFPFICIGNKTISPREGFIRWAEGRTKLKLFMPEGEKKLMEAISGSA